MSDVLDDVLLLERGLESGEVPLPARSGPTDRLELVFRLLLIRLLRAGDGRSEREAFDDASDAGPRRIGRLVELAEASAAEGIVGAGLPGRLREMLDEAGRELRGSGAWDAAAPLWWELLPEPGPMERLWEEVGAAMRLPVRGNPVAAREGVVAAPLLAAIHSELEGEVGPGGAGLGLEAEGVGASGARSAHRSDEVRYLTGREPELLAERPRLAVLVQWCLSEVAPRLAGHPALRERLGPMPPAAPQTAMLARYAGPSGGYSRHLDNPGVEDDNGRALSLVIYLNPEDRCPAGGELEVWERGGAEDEEPRVPVAPCGGNAVLADARRVPHRVRPLRPGPARWTLVLWFRDDQPAAPPPSLRTPGAADLLLAIADPPLPADTLLLREVAGPDDDPRPDLTVLTRRHPPVRCGLVCTTYGAGDGLLRWCHQHLDLGADHLLLVLDRPDDPAEQALADELRRTFPADRLTLWNGPAEAARQWKSLQVPDGAGSDPSHLRRAAAGPADASTSVAARQSLHATAALHAARAGELGGFPLDWLVHLDDDELLLPRGPARGGSDLREHFAALHASDLAIARYLVHELLHPWRPDAPTRFKLNPALATLRLGPTGWRHVREKLGPRPWFVAHTNGKAAVRVESAWSAAGVHGWHLDPDAHHSRVALLDGPDLLHFPVPTEESFRQKLGRRVAGGHDRISSDALFPPSHAEAQALERLAGAPPEDHHRLLADLYRELTAFDAEALDLLEAAGLLFSPDLPHGVPVA